MRRRSCEQTLQMRLIRPGTGAPAEPTLRRTPMSVLLMVLTVVVLSLATSGPAAAQESTPACPGDLNTVPSSDSVVRFVKVAGLIDPAVRDYMLSQLDRAETDSNTVGYVLWMNSNGSVLSDDDYLELATRLRESPVETALWVGNTGSTARGGAAELATVVDLVAVTPNSTIGRTGERRLPPEWGSAFGDAATRLETGLFSASQAIEAGISVGPLENTVPIGSFATMLSGFEVFECVDADGGLATIPTTKPLLSGLPLAHQLFHTVASPEVAYLLFVMGLAIIVFELFVAGVGIAGVIGAGALFLSGYGLAILPVNWWAVALLLLAMFFLAIDIQTNVPRLYTIVGLVCFVLGTWFLYDGVSMSWITALVGIVSAVLYAYTGMPSMVRTRFSTPTIGRKWMIGEMGEAVSAVDPEGTVRIRNAAWRAITNRATPIEEGESIRVIGIHRLILEVEPGEGGAKDYRERRNATSDEE